MKQELNFGPQTDNEKHPPKRHLIIFSTTVSILVLIVLTVFVIQELIEQTKKQEYQVSRSSSEDEKMLAETLEDRGLDLMAAQSWIRYINKTHLNKRDKAKCYYRVGRLFQESKRYDRALEYFYRSELTNIFQDLEAKIEQRKRECFEKLGIDPETGEKKEEENTPSANSP